MPRQGLLRGWGVVSDSVVQELGVSSKGEAGGGRVYVHISIGGQAGNKEGGFPPNDLKTYKTGLR